jgi:putative membrane protein
MSYVIVKYLHFIGILVLASSLMVEHVQLKADMSAEALKKVALIDLIYGISAGVILVTGLLLAFAVGKPSAFYMTNPVFHAKVTLFVLIGLLSIHPTLFLLRHRNSTAASISVPKSIIMVIRLEILLLLIIPLLAVLMARGIGISG